MWPVVLVVTNSEQKEKIAISCADEMIHFPFLSSELLLEAVQVVASCITTGLGCPFPA